MKRGFDRLPGGGCDCRRGRHTTIDLRPEGYLCEEHGPLAERQIVEMDGNVHCLYCLEEVLGENVLPALKRRKLEREEFNGYNLMNGRFIKHEKRE
ncbi:MAG: hypothetical protein A2259_03990 [Candidatus Moranbacteria bacterium RIFOXYA2_FULL_43_15]|nr:MAG: hypothetical protein A2259_03990 [Candidatus Moranbacteria bacterium RIFOXYA2_FULL_43_15]